MKLILALLSLLTVQTHAANVTDATEGQPVCFGREYSIAHMENSPLQTVKTMRLKFWRDQWTGADNFQLKVEAEIVKSREYEESYEGEKVFQVKTKPYSVGMFCRMDGNILDCGGIECDGGSARVTWEIKSADREIVFINNGFRLYGGCDDETDSDNWIWLDPKKGGDDVFRLHALPAEYCQQ